MCTGIRLKAGDGSVVYGRTLEFAQKTDSNILVIPRNHVFTGKTVQGDNGFVWQSQYAAVGANMMGVHELVDGVNEKGLAAGLFYFPGYVGYQDITSDEYKNAIAPWQVVSLILTTCSMVSQVRDLFATVKVGSVTFDEVLGVPPLHVIVHDQTGKSLVIEFVKGQVRFHDNLIGVITNSPTFDWHITNLNNYLNISVENSGVKVIDGVTLHPFGQGAGGFGLPGDFTPPSRFVRAVFFSQAVQPYGTVNEARDAAFHVLNLFKIPVGVVCQTDSSGDRYFDYTQWTAVSDLKNCRYYWNTYDNSQVFMVDLMAMDRGAGGPVVISMHEKAQIYDKTPTN